MKKVDIAATAGVAGAALLAASTGTAGCTGCCGACGFTCILPVAGIACLAVGGQLAIGKRNKGKENDEKKAD